MGPQIEEDYIETVLTCKGDFYDPEFHENLQHFSNKLQNLLTPDHKLILKKVEPWNSVRVTFNIPRDAAVRLKQLAEQGHHTLRQLGILAVQIEGDRSISLTIAGKNNETTELVFQTAPTAPVPKSNNSHQPFELSNANEVLGPSNVEATRKNIAQYLSGQAASAKSAHELESSAAAAAATAAAVSSIDFKPPAIISEFQTQSNATPAIGMASPTRSPSYTSNFHRSRSPVYMSPNHSQHSFPSPSSTSSPSPKYPTPPPSVGPHRVQTFASNGQTLSSTTPVVNNKRFVNARDITSTSPLLVNLLQTDLLAAAGHINNLPINKMPPPHEQGPPQKKRKRKKFKEKSKEIDNSDLVQLVPPSMNIESRVPPLNIDALSLPNMNMLPANIGRNSPIRSPAADGQQMVNPYTGQLEPVGPDDSQKVSTSADSIIDNALKQPSNAVIVPVGPHMGPRWPAMVTPTSHSPQSHAHPSTAKTSASVLPLQSSVHQTVAPHLHPSSTTSRSTTTAPQFVTHSTAVSSVKIPVHSSTSRPLVTTEIASTLASQRDVINNSVRGIKLPSSAMPVHQPGIAPSTTIQSSQILSSGSLQHTNSSVMLRQAIITPGINRTVAPNTIPHSVSNVLGVHMPGTPITSTMLPAAMNTTNVSHVTTAAVSLSSSLVTSKQLTSTVTALGPSVDVSSDGASSSVAIQSSRQTIRTGAGNAVGLAKVPAVTPSVILPTICAAVTCAETTAVANLTNSATDLPVTSAKMTTASPVNVSCSSETLDGTIGAKNAGIMSNAVNKQSEITLNTTNSNEKSALTNREIAERTLVTDSLIGCISSVQTSKANKAKAEQPTPSTHSVTDNVTITTRSEKVSTTTTSGVSITASSIITTISAMNTTPTVTNTIMTSTTSLKSAADALQKSDSSLTNHVTVFPLTSTKSSSNSISSGSSIVSSTLDIIPSNFGHHSVTVSKECEDGISVDKKSQIVNIPTSLVPSKSLISSTNPKPKNGPKKVTNVKVNCVNSSSMNNLDNVGASHVNVEQTNGSTSSSVISCSSNLPATECTKIDKSTISSDSGASSAEQINENHSDIIGDVPSREKSEVKQGMITVGYTLNETRYASPYILSLNKLDEIHKITKTPLVDKINSLSDEVVGHSVVAKLSKKLSTSLESDGLDIGHNKNVLVSPKILDIPSKCKTIDMLTMNGNHLDFMKSLPARQKNASNRTDGDCFSTYTDSVSKEYQPILNTTNTTPASVSGKIKTLNVPYVDTSDKSGLLKNIQDSRSTKLDNNVMTSSDQSKKDDTKDKLVSGGTTHAALTSTAAGSAVDTHPTTSTISTSASAGVSSTSTLLSTCAPLNSNTNDVVCTNTAGGNIQLTPTSTDSKKLQCDTVHPNKIIQAIGDKLQVGTPKKDIEKTESPTPCKPKIDEKCNTKTKTPLSKMPQRKVSMNTMIEFPRNSTTHLTNFVQKASRGAMSSSTQLNQLTSPGFPHNLTESVQKVMMPIHDDSSLVIPHQPKVVRRSNSRPSTSPNISPSAKEVQSVLSKHISPRSSPGVSPMAMYSPTMLHTPQPLTTPTVSSPQCIPTMPVSAASGVRGNIYATTAVPISSTPCSATPRTVMSPVITTHVVNMQALGNADGTSRHAITTRLDLTSAKPTVDNSKRMFPTSVAPGQTNTYSNVTLVKTLSKVQGNVDMKPEKGPVHVDMKTSKSPIPAEIKLDKGPTKPMKLDKEPSVIQQKMDTGLVTYDKVKSAGEQGVTEAKNDPKASSNHDVKPSDTQIKKLVNHHLDTQSNISGVTMKVNHHLDTQSNISGVTMKSSPIAITPVICATVNSVSAPSTTIIVPHVRKKTPSVSSDCSEATSETSVDSKGDELRPTRVSSRIAGRRRNSPEIAADEGAVAASAPQAPKRRQSVVEDPEVMEKRCKLTVDTSMAATARDGTQPVSNTLDDHNYTSPKKTKGVKNNNSSKTEEVVVQNCKQSANTPTESVTPQDKDVVTEDTSNDTPKRSTRSSKIKSTAVVNSNTVLTTTKKTIESSEPVAVGKRRRSSRDHR